MNNPSQDEATVAIGLMLAAKKELAKERADHENTRFHLRCRSGELDRITDQYQAALRELEDAGLRQVYDPGKKEMVYSTKRIPAHQTELAQMLLDAYHSIPWKQDEDRADG